MKYKIFIIEDDKEIASFLSNHLRKYGYSVKCVSDFQNVLFEYNSFMPDVLLIDINLPMYDGFYWCRCIRKLTQNPIIFISARESSMDQVMAIENGGDDYIVKPFSYDLVIAKIKSQIRRAFGEYSTSKNNSIVSVSKLIYDKEKLELKYIQNSVLLTKREGILIETLLSNYPKIVKREMLIQKIWDDTEFVEENTLSVNISRIRKRLSEIGIDNSIETIRGIGYRIKKTWE